jgi:NitT/TauT family transport system substrate-binding protein
MERLRSMVIKISSEVVPSAARMRRGAVRWRLAATVGAVLLASSALASCGSDEGASEPTEVTIGVGGMGSTVYLPTYVADQAGYLDEELEKAGVANYKLVDVGGSTDAIQAVQAGEYSYVTSVTPSMLAAVAKGAKLQEIFTFLEVGNALIMAKPGIFKGNPENLIGKRWGISGFGSTGHAIALQTLKHLGHDADDVKFVSMGSVSSSVAAVEQDLADVYVLGQPGAQLFVADGSLDKVFDFYDPKDVQEVFGGPYSSGAIIAKENTAKEQPKVCSAIVRAHERALQFIRENVDDPEAMAKMLPESIVGNKYYKDVLPRVSVGLSETGEVKASTMQRVLDISKETGLVPSEANIDVSRVLNNSCR